MLQCATSLWSADLANLAAEIKRVEPYSDRFHLDVADGRYVPTLLFFPDLVRAIRPHTRLPFEVHLITARPLDWIEPFCEAGADGFIVYLKTEQDVSGVLAAVRARGKRAGISLRIEEPVDHLEPYWDRIDQVVIIGTDIGIKGADMDPSVSGKVRRAREIIAGRGVKVEIEADGGIRRHTVPLLRAAGVDTIVPGSLLFGGDPAEMRRWLETLG